MRKLTLKLCVGMLVVAVMLTRTGWAQRPVAQININTDKLLPESKEKLASIQQELEKYINDFTWSDNNYRYDIPVQVDVFFERAQPTSFEDQYDARFVISNGSDFQSSDKKWRFPYMQGKVFTHAEQFHPLTGMFDYYLYILLGWEYDKKSKLGGSDYYQKAFQVAQLSKFSEFFSTGWKERSDYIDKILSDVRIPLRELGYFFIQAEMRYRVDDRKAASQYLRVVLLRLNKLSRDDDDVNRFYQLHNLNLARMLSALAMRPELENLVQLDPDNAVTYRQFIDQITE
jgi:hypothetical protein